MKVKRFREDSMQKAMTRVREELGRDAVLISSRRVDGRVEVLAAKDYDAEELEARIQDLPPMETAASAPAAGALVEDQSAESPAAKRERDFRFQLLADKESEKEEQSPAILQMQEELGRLRKLFEGELAQLMWRESHNRQPNRMALLSRLELTGINHDLAARLVDRILPCKDVEVGWQQAIITLIKAMKRPAPDPLQDGGIIAMVGSTGVGKTTTAVKLAGTFAAAHGRNQVALITMDDFRAGQREQFVSLASSMGLSVQVAANDVELKGALDSFAERRLVIIDTAGVNQRSPDFKSQFAVLQRGERKIDPYLVLSATAQESVTNETVRAFSRLKPVAAIVTKTDENVSIGAVLSALIRFRLPAAYAGTGQAIPGDLIRADNRFFVRKLRESYKLSVDQAARQRSAVG